MTQNNSAMAEKNMERGDDGVTRPDGALCASPKSIAFQTEFWCGLMIAALTYLGLMSLLNFDLFGHAVHDSLTLMALSWRQGSLSLINGQNYPYLELAVYKGGYYVSFPSVPALIMLPFTFLFGENTPNTFITFMYLLIAYMGAYKTCRVFRKAADAMRLALFMVLGCNMLQFSLYGGVWNQCQLCNFMFLALFSAGMTGKKRSGWAAGLLCLALSVGCRPFSALYVPLGLWLLYKKLRATGLGVKQAITGMIPYLIAPALIALAMGWYNFARFGNPLEFGHNYLPEHTRNPEEPQFSARYISHNFMNLWRMPKFEGSRLSFGDVAFGGFALWLANPIYVALPIAIAAKLARRRWHMADTLTLGGMALEFVMLLMHKTMGGWQFGARYFCDLIPVMLLFIVGWRHKTMKWEYPIMIFAVAFNIYGAACFHLVSGGY